VANKSAPDQFPLDEIDLLVGWRAGKDEYLFTKAVAIVREWCSTRRRRTALVTSLRRFWLKHVHRPEIARPISSAAETAGVRSYVIDMFGQ
jgi:hypothetical protein